MKQLDDITLNELCKNRRCPEDIVVIDVREPDEYQREHIEGSINLPISQWDTESHTGYENKTVLLHCRSGNRTQVAQAKLNELACKELFCLQGGIDQWKRNGLPTKTNKKAPIEIMRQVQIIVGVLVLSGLISAYSAPRLFMLINTIVGSGLLIAGLTGWCGMARLLKFLPYNQSLKQKGA